MSESQVINKKNISIGVHIGNILSYTMQTYPKLEDVIRELVQNAIDEQPKNIQVIINEEKASIMCFDDGNGASPEEIETIWSKIGISLKSAERGQIGEMGIAKLAGLGIAQKYTMITRPRTQKGSHYFSISVARKDFKGHELPQLLMEEFASGFSHQSRTHASFELTTSVYLKEVNKSAFKELTDLDGLAEYLGDYFSEAISQKGVNLLLIWQPKSGQKATVQVKPREFPGTKQKEIIIPTAHGSVSFEFYTTIKPIKRYKIYVAHSTGSKFLLKDIDDLWAQVKEVLGSGFYQGIIRCGFCELMGNRIGFVRGIKEDAFQAAVLKFVNEYCEPYLTDMKSYSRLERYSQIIKRAVDFLDQLFLDNPAIKLQLKNLQGLVSDSHIGSEKGEPTDEAYRRKAPRFEEVIKNHDGEREVHPPKREKGKMMHPAFPHPTGRRKKRIKGQHGISIGYKEADDSTGYSWRTRVDEGTIYFNISHQDWREAEDKSTLTLQQYVNLHTIKELAVLMAQENSAKHFRDVFEKNFTPFASMLTMK